jgi:hypothetical protein
MGAPVQLIREPLVNFPTDPVGHDGTQVWLLAYAGRLLRDPLADVPLEITTQLLFPIDRFIGLDLTWKRHQRRYKKLRRGTETDPILRSNYLTAYELAAVDTGRPYLLLSTVEHPQLTRPLMTTPHLYGAFLIGITHDSYSDWHCTQRNLTQLGQTLCERVKRVFPATVLGLLTLRGTDPLVPLTLESDASDA